MKQVVEVWEDPQCDHAKSNGDKCYLGAAIRAILMAVTRFSGPRLTPPARLIMSARPRSGREDSGMPFSDSVAGHLSQDQPDGHAGERQNTDRPPE